MTDPEVLTETDIDRVVSASRRSDGNLWVAGFYAARVVGTYAEAGTREIADRTGKDPSTVENWAHAWDLYNEIRNGINSGTARTLRKTLTLSHFSNAWELRRKYDLSLEVITDHLEQIVIYREQGHKWSSEALRQEVDAQEDKTGNVPTWNYYAPRLNTMCTNILAATDTPQEIKDAALTIVKYFERN